MMGEAKLVMVVDDDEDILETYAAFLESLGYQALTAQNGKIALEQLRSGARPSLILLDLMMPEMNGWTFRAELLARPELASIPVVVFSGDYRALAEAPPAAVEAVFQKPVNLDALVRTLSKHLEG
jgi:two-component system response regulator MprA